MRTSTTSATMLGQMHAAQKKQQASVVHGQSWCHKSQGTVHEQYLYNGHRLPRDGQDGIVDLELAPGTGTVARRRGSNRNSVWIM